MARRVRRRARLPACRYRSRGRRNQNGQAINPDPDAGARQRPRLFLEPNCGRTDDGPVLVRAPYCDVALRAHTGRDRRCWHGDLSYCHYAKATLEVRSISVGPAQEIAAAFVIRAKLDMHDAWLAFYIECKGAVLRAFCRHICVCGKPFHRRPGQSIRHQANNVFRIDRQRLRVCIDDDELQIKRRLWVFEL